MTKKRNISKDEISPRYHLNSKATHINNGKNREIQLQKSYKEQYQVSTRTNIDSLKHKYYSNFPSSHLHNKNYNIKQNTIQYIFPKT